MDKLNNFWSKLVKYKKEPDWERNPYDADRMCIWCHLLVKHNGKLHRFEVRNGRLSDDAITLSVVNWTICAGAATLTLGEETVSQYLIEEDDPTVGLLYAEE